MNPYHKMLADSILKQDIALSKQLIEFVLDSCGHEKLLHVVEADEVLSLLETPSTIDLKDLETFLSRYNYSLVITTHKFLSLSLVKIVTLPVLIRPTIINNLWEVRSSILEEYVRIWDYPDSFYKTQIQSIKEVLKSR